ncbi:MAG: hypothetical protein EBU90_04115 [Proteobacteria bacterium]|nr:hypothetical protein [Pseudomonadota bacterium]NBP13922.1 hypothetical protein [bacterium]
MKRNKQERLQVVLDICKQLKRFPKSSYLPSDPNPYFDLYNSDYSAIQQLKTVFRDFVNQDDSNPNLLSGLSGKIKFPELNRRIEYVLPIKKSVTPTFVLRTLENNNTGRFVVSKFL